jgi:hypothetical protein
MLGPVVIDPGTPIASNENGEFRVSMLETTLFFDCPFSADDRGFVYFQKRSGDLVVVHRSTVR